MSDEVCAAIVTFHPDEDFEEAVAILRPQVGRLVVVDNHSSPEAVRTLRLLAEKYDFVLIENSENYGLGTALNQAVVWTRANSGCEFILFLDQDSSVSQGFVAKMVTEYRKHAENERIFLVIPKIVHRRLGHVLPQKQFKGEYLVAQTSGSLLPVRVFAEEGLHKEDLFIEFIDFDFCLRAVNKGWRIASCRAATLYHEPGNATTHSILHLFKVTTSNSSPLRKYYSVRNGLWTLRQYGLRYPHWALGTAYLLLKGVLRALLLEKNRCAMIRMWRLAIWDFLNLRLGKFDHPKAS